jgi:hypothetical protein
VVGFAHDGASIRNVGGQLEYFRLAQWQKPKTFMFSICLLIGSNDVHPSRSGVITKGLPKHARRAPPKRKASAKRRARHLLPWGGLQGFSIGNSSNGFWAKFKFIMAD